MHKSTEIEVAAFALAYSFRLCDVVRGCLSYCNLVEHQALAELTK